MPRTIIAAAILLFSFNVSYASAADVKKKFMIENAKMDSAARSVLEGDIKMYWGDQPYPKVIEKHGVFKTSKRTNGFMKDNEQACSHALASALLVFQDRALREGGNAVIGLVSNIKDIEEPSTTQYSCLVGAMMVNVALKGTVVTIENLWCRHITFQTNSGCTQSCPCFGDVRIMIGEEE